MRFVIVTGMSGAGKSTALKMLEDMEYFCVDNLPVPLLDKFAQLVRDGGSGDINNGTWSGYPQRDGIWGTGAGTGTP